MNDHPPLTCHIKNPSPQITGKLSPFLPHLLPDLGSSESIEISLQAAHPSLLLA